MYQFLVQKKNGLLWTRRLDLVTKPDLSGSLLYSIPTFIHHGFGPSSLFHKSFKNISIFARFTKNVSNFFWILSVLVMCQNFIRENRSFLPSGNFWQMSKAKQSARQLMSLHRQLITPSCSYAQDTLVCNLWIFLLLFIHMWLTVWHLDLNDCYRVRRS